MANIEAYRTDVPLYQVVEHLVGDLDRLAALRRSSKIAAWDHALKDLIGAVSLAKLKARGRRPGSQLLEAISRTASDMRSKCTTYCRLVGRSPPKREGQRHETRANPRLARTWCEALFSGAVLINLESLALAPLRVRLGSIGRL
jgi:hypothetical protein